MVNYIEFYIPLKKELINEILPSIKNFGTSFDTQELENLQFYSFQFHNDIKNKLSLFENQLKEYVDTTKKTESKIRNFIINCFNDKIRLNKDKGASVFYNVATCWKNILLNNYQEHYYVQQFDSAKKLINTKKAEFKNFKEFYNYITEHLKFDIQKAQEHQKRLIGLIKEISRLLDKHLKITWIGRLEQRNFDLLKIIITGLLMLIASAGGGYMVYTLSIDKSPQLFVYSEFMGSDLHIEVMNTQNVATNTRIRYKVKELDGWTGIENIGLLKEEKIIKNIKPDVTYIGKELLEKDDNFLEEGDYFVFPLNLEINVICDNCGDNDILYIKGWYAPKEVRCEQNKNLECGISNERK